MASRPIHPKQKAKKRSRGPAVMDGTANRAGLVGPHEQLTEALIARGSGPIGPHEQASASVAGDIDNPPPAATRSRATNGTASQRNVNVKRIRFHVSLQAKLAKGTEFSVCVSLPDTNRGPVVIESIHVGIYRKGETLFDGDIPIRKESKVIPGAKKILPFSDTQKKELSGVLKSKTFALVRAVYTAPTQTEVTFSIENQDDKKK